MMEGHAQKSLGRCTSRYLGAIAGPVGLVAPALRSLAADDARTRRAYPHAELDREA